MPDEIIVDVEPKFTPNTLMGMMRPLAG